MTNTETPLDPVAALSAAGQVVAGLQEVLWAAKRPQELLGAKQQLEVLRSQLAAVDAQLVHEIEVSKAHTSAQWGSAADYLTAVCAGRQGDGRRDLRVADALVTDRGMTLAALRAGSVSAEQARVIVAVIERLPVKASLRDAAEDELLIRAKVLNATELEAVGRRLVELLDPDGSERRDEAALRKQERSAHLGRHLTITDDGLGGVRVRGRGTVEDAAVIRAALMSLTRPEPAELDEDDQPGSGGGSCSNDGRDPRDYSTRLWDAFVALCQQGLDSGVLPESHGAKPRVTVTISEEGLRERLGSGRLATGQTLSASAVRAMACDADILPVVLGSRSEILDVGRLARLVTAAIWAALVARDEHCTFPGCRRPPIACDAHHIVHWIDRGPTSLPNLALLCRRHHLAIHDTGWEIRLNPHDMRPEFRPPDALDPGRAWIRARPNRPRPAKC